MNEPIPKEAFPCNTLGYCPYGCLVEYFPLHGKHSQWKGVHLPWINPENKAEPCPIFGHDCPVFHVALKEVISNE